MVIVIAATTRPYLGELPREIGRRIRFRPRMTMFAEAADGGRVAAEVRAEGRRPPQRLRSAVSLEALSSSADTELMVAV
jgi:hypothetical protein